MRPILILLVLLTFVGSVGFFPVTRAAEAPGTAGLRLEWTAPPYQLATVVAEDGQTYTRLEVDAPGYLVEGPPGWPALPRRGDLVALPPGGDFGLELIEVVYQTLSLEHPLEPAPAPAPLETDASGAPLPGGRVFARDAAAYAAAEPLPASPVALGDAVWMRDHRLARLTFTPIRYHPARGTLDVVRRVRLRLWWDPPATAASRPPIEDPFEGLLATIVLNPADLEAFRAPGRAGTAQGAPLEEIRVNQRAPASPAYKVLVETAGLYALDYATLDAAGLPLENVDPATLRLDHAGVEVAGRWDGDGDTIFEAGERLLFYARPQPTRYAGYDVYWLSWGGAPARRMAYRSGAPSGLSPGTAWATARAEENVEYDGLRAGHDGDRWFWRRLKRPDAASDTLELPLQTPAPGTAGQLTVWLRGFTSVAPDPDHHVRFSVNGTPVGDRRWDGQTLYTATLPVPAGLLAAGTNAVHLELPGDTGSEIEGTWVDAIAITYGLNAVSDDVARFRGHDSPRAYTVGGFSSAPVQVYDVTDPHGPRVVTGFSVAGGRVSVGDHGPTPAEYLILTAGRVRSPAAVVPVKSVSDPPAGADYLFIAHPDFAAALAPLVAHRAAQGLRVATVDAEAIYDQFGDGRMDPAAIRAFLAHAYANWSAPALQYVLLVGDATYDPRRYRPDSNPTFLPPYLAHVDVLMGETAADNRYADLTGDPLPELRLGRFPVNTPAQVTAIVQKTISYETDPLSGVWNRRLLFSADNPSTAGRHPDHADGEFFTYGAAPGSYFGTRVYLSETAGASHLYTDAEAAQDALIAELNRGGLFYSYFGHASWHQEAVLETDGYAPLFHRDHIARLDNARRWPVVLQMTCLTSFYIHRTSNTLDESLLRTADVGAVATWGPSGSGVATGHRILHRSFYQAVLDRGQSELGAATHAALANLYANGGYSDLLETFLLFGDPALGLNVPSDLHFFVFLPIIGQGFGH